MNWRQRTFGVGVLRKNHELMVKEGANIARRSAVANVQLVQDRTKASQLVFRPFENRIADLRRGRIRQNALGQMELVRS